MKSFSRSWKTAIVTFLERLLGRQTARRTPERGADLFANIDQIYGKKNFRVIFDVGANVGQTPSVFFNVMMKKLKHELRKIVLVLPGGTRLLEKRLYNYQKRELAKIGDSRAVFEHYFKTNAWQDTETVSGPGSTIEYTKSIREHIPLLLADLDIRQVLDAPCGDYNWFRLIERSADVTYIGGDIVMALIERNQSMYGDGTTTFRELDIVRDRLPLADLWICRDCFIHLSNRDVFLAVAKFLNSSVSYLLTSTYPNVDRNTDIVTGQFRSINLQIPPFKFGPPEKVMEDWIDGFEVRHLALWKRETLKLRLADNKAYHPSQKGRNPQF